VDGQVLETKDASHITREQVEEAMKKFIGDFHQLPPMVSAIKIKGVPLYKMARKGETVERETRLVHVYEFRILDFAPTEIRFVLKCTKGTYVRTICHDIGQALGVGAHLASLRRTRSGDFDVKDAITLADFLAAKPDDIIPRVLPMTSVRTPQG
jgi:tRNA pseudouridine55 synthase